MPEQLYLPGLCPRNERDFLFFGLLLEQGDAERVARVRERLCEECHLRRRRLIAPDCLHVSLHGLREYEGLPKALVRQATAAGALVSMPPFEIRFDRAMSFAGKEQSRAFVLRAARNSQALVALHQALGRAMNRVGLWAARSSFTPHVTLLYNERLVSERQIEPVHIQARSFVLIHSLRGRSIYNHLARWPLREAAIPKSD